MDFKNVKSHFKLSQKMAIHNRSFISVKKVVVRLLCGPVTAFHPEGYSHAPLILMFHDQDFQAKNLKYFAIVMAMAMVVPFQLALKPV
jgi:hypothetical protein